MQENGGRRDVAVPVKEEEEEVEEGKEKGGEEWSHALQKHCR